jgi:uncharacterized protein
MQWGVRIPMRDGVRLSATLYCPEKQGVSEPCIFALTPYTAQRSHTRGCFFAARGYPFLAVDSRGRGNSEGTFNPFFQEGKDGHDIVEWIATQPFCNGSVAMFSGSYEGYAQWATAKEFPPHLATIVPAAAAAPGVDFPMRNNIGYPYVVQWLMLVAGHTSQDHIFQDQSFWRQKFRAWHESGKSYSEIDSYVGYASSSFQEWLSHPEDDSYWDAFKPSSKDYSQLRLPILTLTGSYDDDQPGALHYYREHIRNAPPAEASKHFLVIGPWDHAGTLAPRTEFGGVVVGKEASIDILQLHLDWYAWVMRGGAKPNFLEKRVAYYVMGADQWQYADSLAEVTAKHLFFYLDSAGRADDVFASGMLGFETGTGLPDSYIYDPRDVAGAEIEAEASVSGSSLVDQSLVHALSGKQLVYHSEPLETDLEISGFFNLSAWIAIDTPDTDFYVSVHEIGPNGSSIRLSTDSLRARYRENLRTPNLIRTQEPLRYDFKNFTFVSRLVKRGHRLRLVIGPMGRLIDATFAQRNFNSGGVVAEESVRDARPVTVRLFHESGCNSVLYVPVGKPQA